LGYSNAVGWTLSGLSKFMDSTGSWRDRGRGQYESADCLWTVHVRGRCLVVDC